jgi:hypothetical protein
VRGKHYAPATHVLPRADPAFNAFRPAQIATMSLESLSGLKPPSECNPKELLVTRETYELACLHVSLKQKDMSSFERHMAQLKTIYTDYSALIPKSDRQMELQGLSLLSLLAQSKIAEFHTELELIPVSLCLVFRPFRLSARGSSFIPVYE